MDITNVSTQGTSVINSQQSDEVKNQIAARGDSVLSGGISVLYMFMNLLSELADAKYGQMQQKAEVSRQAQEMSNQVDEVIAEVSKGDDKAVANLPANVIKYMSKNGFKIDGMSIDKYLSHNDPSAAYLKKLLGKIAEAGPQGMQSASWQDVISYMDAKGIKIDGQKSSDYIWGLPEVGRRSWQNISKAHMQKIADTLAASGGLDKGKLQAVKAELASVSNRASDFVSQSQLQLQKIMQTYNVTVSLLNSMQTMLAEMNKSIAQNVR